MLCTGVTCFRTFCKTTQMSLSVLRGLRGTWWPSTLAVAQKQDSVKDSPNALHFINISFRTSLSSQESQVNWRSEERMRERFNPREKPLKHLHLLTAMCVCVCVCVYIPLMKQSLKNQNYDEILLLLHFELLQCRGASVRSVMSAEKEERRERVCCDYSGHNVRLFSCLRPRPTDLFVSKGC